MKPTLTAGETLRLDGDRDGKAHAFRGRIPFFDIESADRGVQPQNVRVLELGGDRDFPQKPIGAHRSRDLGKENLDGDAPLVLQVAGKVHGRHPTLSQVVLDGVATVERAPYPPQPVRRSQNR